MRLKKYARFRREAFGGLLLSDNPWRTLVFVKSSVVDALERGELTDRLRQFLIDRDIVEGEKSRGEQTWEEYELSELEIPGGGGSHLSTPITAAIEITNKCNLRCIHCANRAGEKTENDLTTEEVRGLLLEWKQLGVFTVTVTGGEPFSRPDMVELLQYADDLGLRVIVLTNALLITRELLKEIPRSIGFQISLDGLGFHYEAVRGPGTYSRLLEAIHAMKDDGRALGATLVFTKLNSQHAIEVMRFCLENGIRLKMDPLLPLGRALDLWHYLVPGKEDADNFLDARELKIRHYTQEYRTRFPKGRPLNMLDIPEIFAALFRGCEGGRTDLWVKYNGDVHPCANLSAAGEFKLGNVRETSCQDIWTTSQALREFRELGWAAFRRCVDCDISDYCTYRCPASSLFYHGDYSVCGANDFIREVIRRARDRGITDRVDGQ